MPQARQRVKRRLLQWFQIGIGKADEDGHAASSDAEFAVSGIRVNLAGSLAKEEGIGADDPAAIVRRVYHDHGMGRSGAAHRAKMDG